MEETQNSVANNKINTHGYGYYDEEDDDDGFSIFNFRKLWEIIVLNWMWFVLSALVFGAGGYLIVKKTVPMYKVSADFLVKGDKNSGRSTAGNVFNSLSQNGFVANSEGIGNEVRIMRSKLLAKKAIKKLGLYVNISEPEGLRRRDIYLDAPIQVTVSDPDALEKLNWAISLKVTREGNKVSLSGGYGMQEDYGGGYYEINVNGPLPQKINTKIGTVLIEQNPKHPLKDGQEYQLDIYSPDALAGGYVGGFSAESMSEETSIIRCTFTNSNVERARAYLAELLNQYNEQANEDKNEIAQKTEAFINERLEKISNELGNTDGQMAQYKKANEMIDAGGNGAAAFAQKSALEQRMDEAAVQSRLLNYLSEYINDSRNKYQIIPSNIGLTEGPSTALIGQYNEFATTRTHLLLTTSESHPSVIEAQKQMDNIMVSLRKAIAQAKQTADIQQQSLSMQYGKYSGRVGESPEQERTLTQIGRQQEVRSSLYIMLLQKREENSLSLSATANKGRMIDEPAIMGQASPNKMKIMGIALGIGLLLPLVILLILELLKYKVEGREDVMKITRVPIIADVMLAKKVKDKKAGIIVRADKNGTMEEIFRGIRTNLSFMLKENQKVILFTSSIAGEGKTFNAANTAMSFALLKKKTIIIGLDIRKPRLGELFGLKNITKHGITNLLRMEKITKQDVIGETCPSAMHDYLDLMMAGPIPPNPAELLERESLEKVIDILKEEYDYIILDTAPVGLVTDTIIINRVADATIYVVRADYTPKDEINMLNDLVDGRKLHNVGIIINALDMSKKKYGYQYGYGRYGKYGRYGRYGKYGKRYGYGYGYGYGGYHYHYGYGYGHKDSYVKDED